MTQDPDENPSLELGRFVAVLKRRWLAVAVGLMIGVLGAAALLAFMPRTSKASTLVNINVISTEPFKQDRPASDLVDAQTETQLARSTEVVTAVSKGMGGAMTPQEVRRASDVVLLADGTVLRVSFSAAKPEQARQGANDIAQAYLQYRSKIAQDKVDAVVDQLTARRTELTTELASIQLLLTPKSTGAARARLQAQSQVTNQALSSLTSQLTSIQSLDTGGGTVLTSADRGTTSISPRKGLVVASGVLGGLGLGLVLAFMVNLADRRVRDAHDVEAAGGGAILARIQRSGGPVHPTDEEADAMRSLRERLLAIVPERRPVVAVADVSREGVPTNIAINLALVSAQVGLKVHLVLLEYSAPFVKNLVELLELTPVASNNRLPLTVSRRYPLVSVTLPLQDPQGDDNSADQVVDLLRDNDEQGFDLTLIGLPKNSSRSLRLAVGRTGHAFVLVVTERDTRIDQIAEMSAELAAVRAVIHGSVMVPKDSRMAHRRAKKESSKRPPTVPRAAKREGFGRWKVGTA